MSLSTQTRNEAYYRQRDTGRLQEEEERVLSFFANHPDGATRGEISEWYNYPINKTAGRCNSLVKKGLLVSMGKKKVNGYNQEILKLKPRQEGLF